MSASLGKPDRSPPPPPPSPFPCAMFSTRQRGLPTNIPLRDLSPSLGSTDSTEWKLLTPARERISHRKTLTNPLKKGSYINFLPIFPRSVNVYSCNLDRRYDLTINILRDRHQIVAMSANFLTPAHLNVPFKVSSGRLVACSLISRLTKTLRFEFVRDAS